MLSKSIGEYIYFGTALRYLQDCKHGWKAQRWGVHGTGKVLNNIQTFLDCLKDFNLPVTQRASFSIKCNLQQTSADIEGLYSYIRGR